MLRQLNLPVTYAGELTLAEFPQPFVLTSGGECITDWY